MQRHRECKKDEDQLDKIRLAYDIRKMEMRD